MGLYEEFDGALAVVANTTFHLPPVSGGPPILVSAFLTWVYARA